MRFYRAANERQNGKGCEGSEGDSREVEASRHNVQTNSPKDQTDAEEYL